MRAQEFVETVDREVGRAAVDDVLSQLQKPAGRQPPEGLVQLSQWYNALDDGGKAFVREIIAETASAALFGFYCVLDGSRTILDDPELEFVELVYRSEAGENVIASTSLAASQPPLHEMRGSLI